MIHTIPKAFSCVIVAGLFLVGHPTSAQAGEGGRYQYLITQTEPGRDTKANQDQKRKKMLDKVNAQRKARGCPPLRENSKLSEAAQAQADAMQKKRFFGHKGPDGDTPDKRARERGYRYRDLAENLAASQEEPDEVVNGWLGSKSHREVMLDCRYTEVGSGHRHTPDDQPHQEGKAPYYDYWAQVYARPKDGK
jgi:uncharacterized protein YkwD